MSEWIKCADKMPELGVEVLTFGECGYVEIESLSETSTKNWSSTQNFQDVTHWMPLPAPPTEVEQ